MNKKLTLCVVIFTVTSFFLLQAQSDNGDQSFLTTMQELADEVTQMISDTLSSLEGDISTNIYIQGIRYNNANTQLGNLFGSLITTRVSQMGMDNIKIFQNSRPGAAGEGTVSFIVSGEVFRVSSQALLNIRVTQRPGDNVLAALDRQFEWNQDLAMTLRGASSGASSGDRFEPNNNPDSANILEQEARLTGLSLSSGDFDWFYVDLTSLDMSGDVYSVLTVETDSNFDTYIEMYGPDESDIEFMRDDDGGDDANARIIAQIDIPGIYYIKIRGYSSSSTGSYTLLSSLETREPEAGEPNDTFSTAFEITPDMLPLERNLFPAGDNDIFIFSTQDFQLGENDILSLNTSGNLDTTMELYDSNQNWLDSDDDSGPGTNASISISASPGESYYIEVAGYSGSTTGPYTLNYEILSIELDEYETDNEFETASSIDLGDTQNRTLSPDSDQDWISFTLAQDERVVIETSSDADTYLELYDEDGNFIDENDDGGSGYNARISIELEAGTYVFLVKHFGGESDELLTEYSVTVE